MREHPPVVVETQDGGGIGGGLTCTRAALRRALRSERERAEPKNKLSVTHAGGTPRRHACPQLTYDICQKCNTSLKGRHDLAMPKLRTLDPGDQQRFCTISLASLQKIRKQRSVGRLALAAAVSSSSSLSCSRNITCASSLQLLCSSLCLPEFCPSAPSA